jgi:hypothetical protein
MQSRRYFAAGDADSSAGPIPTVGDSRLRYIYQAHRQRAYGERHQDQLSVLVTSPAAEGASGAER